MVLWSIVFLNTFEVILQLYAQFFFWLLLTEAIEDKYNTSNLNRISALMTLPIIIYGYVVMVIYFLLIIGSLAVLIGGSKSGYLNFNKGLVDEYNKALASREINRQSEKFENLYDNDELVRAVGSHIGVEELDKSQSIEVQTFMKEGMLDITAGPRKLKV